MKPDSSEPTELHQRLRQQLILAQARIMELEDARDELAPKLIEAEKMQRAAQQLADQKVHLARNADSLVADHAARLSTAEQRAAQLQRELGEATKLLQQQKTAFAALEEKITETSAASIRRERTRPGCETASANWPAQRSSLLQTRPTRRIAPPPHPNCKELPSPVAEPIDLPIDRWPRLQTLIG